MYIRIVVLQSISMNRNIYFNLYVLKYRRIALRVCYCMRVLQSIRIYDFLYCYTYLYIVIYIVVLKGMNDVLK